MGAEGFLLAERLRVDLYGVSEMPGRGPAHWQEEFAAAALTFARRIGPEDRPASLAWALSPEGLPIEEEMRRVSEEVAEALGELRRLMRGADALLNPPGEPKAFFFRERSNALERLERALSDLAAREGMEGAALEIAVSGKELDREDRNAGARAAALRGKMALEEARGIGKGIEAAGPGPAKGARPRGGL